MKNLKWKSLKIPTNFSDFLTRQSFLPKIGESNDTKTPRMNMPDMKLCIKEEWWL